MNIPQLTKGDKLSLVLGTAGVGLSIFDALKSQGIDTSNLKGFIEKDRINTREHVKTLDPSIKIIDSKKTLSSFIDLELGDRSIIVQAQTKKLLGKAIESGNNAFAYPGKDGDNYIIAPKEANPTILAHEVGHIQDFRDMRENKCLDKMKAKDRSVIRGLGRMFSKRVFKKDIVEREQRAWNNVPGEKKKELEQAAINSYTKSFHYGRGMLAGTLGGSSIGSVAGFQLGRKFGRPKAGSIIGSVLGTVLGGIPAHLTRPQHTA